MTAYIHPLVAQDPASIKAGMISDLQGRFPSLEVPAGSLLDALLDVFASRHAEDGELLTEVAAEVFRAYGQRVLRVLPVDATPASGASTWTLSDDDGHTIPAGTQLTLAAPGGSRVAFQVTQDIEVPAGSTATATGEVPIEALVAGADGTGLQADAQLEAAISWVQSITVVAPTTGGEDAEGDDAYLDRVATRAQLLTDTLVTPADTELAARLFPGVGRALAIDLYDASTDTPDVGGHITVRVTSSEGLALSGAVKAALTAQLVPQAMTNLQIHVTDAVYTALAIVFAGVAHPDYDPAEVEARAEQAILDLIDPAFYGSPTFGDTDVPGVTWEDTPILRYQDVVTALNNVEGFDHYTSLTINGGTADVNLGGPGALPDPASTVAGTVT